MTSKANHFHGSDIEKIAAMYDVDIQEVVNYSANVNPLGLSNRLVEALAQNVSVIETYPDRDYTSLREHIGAYCGIDTQHVMVGNGSTELIALFIQSTRPNRALIIGPTYSEYEREISMNGGTAVYFPLSQEDAFSLDLELLRTSLAEDIDILIVCNPNNPTSTCIPVEVMEKIVAMCGDQGTYVMIDETYIEFTDNMPLYTAASLIKDYDNLFIIRGVSKFFAAPGLRLGYGLCGNLALLGQMNHVKFPWTINSIASYAGEVMFMDEDYMQATRQLILSEGKRIYQLMNRWTSVHVYKPQANFILVKILREDITAFDVFEYLIKKNMMVRNASTFKFLDEGFFRFCFMKPEDNERLLDALYEFLETK